MRAPERSRPEVGEVVAIVGGMTMRYVPGDAMPPPPPPMPGWRRCRSCGDEYPAATGKNCECWQRGYDAQRGPT